MSTFKTFLITGTSRGIGLELTRQLLSESEDRIVYATARNPSTATKLQELKKQFGDRLHIEELDVESEESIKNIVQKLNNNNVKIDVLVNNAGVGSSDKITESTKQTLNNVFNINVVGPVLVAQHFYNANLINKGGLIINISSPLVSISFQNEQMAYGSYNISKAALNMASKLQSITFKDVSVVPVNPGWLKTDMGGENAPLEVGVGVAGIVKIINNFKPEQNGKFLSFDGGELNW
ncbi:hypothetical protein ABK040_008557 [Willaertia magna]